MTKDNIVEKVEGCVIRLNEICQELGKRCKALEAKLKAYESESGVVAEKYRVALEEIANSEYTSYENNGSGLYGTGVTDGHRYCADIAKAALLPAPNASNDGGV